MRKIEEKLIEQARMLAHYCEGRCRHVSFLMIRNKIVSIGLNSYRKTHVLADKFGHLGANIHSELSACVNLPRSIDITRTTLYNVRIRTDGKVALSMPCRCCSKLILAYNIRRVYYSTNQGLFERMF